ncbi:MAG TPA: helix-turn-helix domain-containing protein [Caulobacteraceae bacterium]|nr:helix-turn-helix domain-containing protein [Caulobacteraceae bacterium]
MSPASAAKLSPKTEASAPRPTAKDTRKSQRTRRRILDAAMELFAERGYHACTNADVAEAAKLTRGAMLYHFPTRDDLVLAAIDHIQERRNLALAEAARDALPGEDLSDQAIDAYWALLQETPFRAFAELEAAAGADKDLAAKLAPAQAAFDRAQVGAELSGMLQAGSAARFQTSRDIARFMLEGLSRANLTYDEDERIERLLTVIKRVTRVLNRKGGVHELWED